MLPPLRREGDPLDRGAVGRVGERAALPDDERRHYRRGGGRRAAEAGADGEVGEDLEAEAPSRSGKWEGEQLQLLGGFSQRHFHEMRGVLAAHGREALGGGIGGVGVPALPGGLRVGAHRLPAGRLGVGEAGEVEVDA